MIRRGRSADAPEVTRIFRESRAEAMPWLPVLHTPGEDLAWFRAALAGEAYVFCARATRVTQGTGLEKATPSSPAFEQAGRIVGYAVVREDELHDLYVAPESQGRGVGSALFDRVRESRPRGFRLWVFRDNTRARRFYEARGCRAIDATDGDNKEGLPDVLYEWRPAEGSTT